MKDDSITNTLLMKSCARLLYDPKIHISLISTIVSLLVLILVPSIAQDPTFHDFADQREFYGIPHFWNVVSNIPFLVVGLMGIIRIKTHKLPGVLPYLGHVYNFFFMGLILIGLGSGYYHLDPTNPTLIWDRLAITITFISFFVLVFGESISLRTAGRLLWPLLLFGLASVGYWYFSEIHGNGDLRIYGLVQFLPMLLTPLMLFAYGSRLSGRVWVLAILCIYTGAKAVEFYDQEIYNGIGFSGHSLKHLLAAFGAFLLLISLHFRKPNSR